MVNLRNSGRAAYPIVIFGGKIILRGMDQTMEKNTCLALSLEFANFRIALNACLFQFAIYTRNTILEKLCIMEYYALCARNDFVTCRQQLKWNFNRIFYNRWLIPRIQLNNHSCLTEKDHFCWEYIYNILYINTSIYTKFDLRFELSFLERFPFSQPRRNQIFPSLLPTSCDCGHNTGGSLRDDTKRRNPY